MKLEDLQKQLNLGCSVTVVGGLYRLVCSGTIVAECKTLEEVQKAYRQYDAIEESKRPPTPWYYS